MCRRSSPNEWSAHSQSDISIGHKGLTGCENQNNLDIDFGHNSQTGGRHQNKPTLMSLHVMCKLIFFGENDE